MSSSEEKPLHSHVLFHTWRKKGDFRAGPGHLGWGCFPVGGMGRAQAAHVEVAPAEDAWSYFGTSGDVTRAGSRPLRGGQALLPDLQPGH